MIAKLWKELTEAKRAQRNAEIAAIVKQTTSIELQVAEEENERRHVENKTFMGMIRDEGIRREGVITGRLDVLHGDMQREVEARSIETRALNQHIIDLLKSQGMNRRSRDA